MDASRLWMKTQASRHQPMTGIVAGAKKKRNAQGHRSKAQREEYGVAFDEADRVINAIKQKLEADNELRVAFRSNSIEFLRRQKLQDSIKEAFLNNADEFLSFMSKTEIDPGFGKFFSPRCSSGIKKRLVIEERSE
jgi:hypothetical protein